MSFTFIKILFYFLFPYRGEEKGKEREKNTNVRLLLSRSLPGAWPATQAHALTGIEPTTLWFAVRHSVH